MGERRSFQTHAGAGGIESEYLGLPFKSTPCEDWYGFGDNKCPNRYIETGDLETDIISLKKWSGLYGGHGRTHWKVWASNELERKQAEFNIIRDAQEKKRLAEEQARQSLRDAINRAVEQKIRETTKPKETVIVTPPETVEKVVQYSPLLIAGIGIIVFIIILRRRA